MKIDQAHTFSQEEASARLRALTDYWSNRYGVSASWQGDTARIQGKVKGISFDGTFTVQASRLVGDVKVGFLAEKMGGRAYVENKLGKYLDPQNTLEELQAQV